MKFFLTIAFSALLLLSLASCKKDQEKNWDITVKKPVTSLSLTDISAEFYNPAIPLEAFKAKYPWFQGTVPDEDFAERRQDSTEIKVYREATAKIDQKKLKTDLQNLFSHVVHYFPNFKVPKVYLYSSALMSVKDPIFYHPEDHLLFIDITGFMGENNAYYKGLEQYFQRSMNPVNIVPKVSEILAENFVPFSTDHQKFLDLLVYEGKLMTLQDAFLPGYPDYLKINYTAKQYEWAVGNEVNIWDYFVENNLVFSDDSRLTERFIAPGPFSKFYTEVDNDSSPQIGIFTGWQICRKFFAEKPDTPLQDFLKMDAQNIFNTAQYKPKFSQ